MNNFTAIISVYKNDNPVYFEEAVNSILAQTLPPSELIISIDGPLTPQLNSSILKFSRHHFVKILRLSVNKGPGASRHKAILSATHDLIAVMDSDDISVNFRFCQQINYLNNSSVDIVGGFIEEFIKIPGDLPSIRVVPRDHENIVHLSKWRSPMNNVTIMFRKKSYLMAGGYGDLRYLEDYDLFYRMILSGAKFANIQEVLVYVRVGETIALRRRGMQYLRTELGLIWLMRRAGFLKFWQWLLNSVIRILVRLMPVFVLKFVYKFLRNKK